jgi:DHA1 family inner membrane transport protein
MPLSVFVLAIGAFAICTTEFVIMGLLLEIAQDLQVSISGAGFLVTGYALGVVVGAPLLMPFLIKTPRKAALVSLMVLFVLGNVACALAPTYDTLLAARVVTAFVQANFFGVGSIVAAKLAPPGRQASAIAAMFLGVTLANVAGAPAGTMLGQEYGWRMTFVAVAAIGVLATVSTAMLVPSIPKDEEQHNLRQEFGVLMQPAVLRALLITVLGFGGIFTVFTYIAPLMTQVTGMPEATVPAVILLFGVGMVIGNPIGGRMADRSLLLSLRLSLLLLIGSLALLAFAMYNPITMVAAVFLFGIAGFTTLTPLQVHVLAVAAKAPTLAAAFNIGAFNLGNAAGAWLGGLTIDGTLGPTAVPWVGALISLSGLALTLTVRSREPKLASS